MGLPADSSEQGLSRGNHIGLAAFGLRKRTAGPLETGHQKDVSLGESLRTLGRF